MVGYISRNCQNCRLLRLPDVQHLERGMLKQVPGSCDWGVDERAIVDIERVEIRKVA